MKGAETGGFSRFCVVGCGNHARTKLIPAIHANGQQLVGVVSSRPQPDLGTAVFSLLGDALAGLPPETAFILSSPPKVHFAQTAAILSARRDVIVEKPAFITMSESEQAYAIAESNRVVLAEAFMHRHTELFGRLMNWWAGNEMYVGKIEIAFLIPTLPPETFRSDPDIACSGLYDMGCYALSLLVDLGLPLDGLVLQPVIAVGDSGLERIELGGQPNGVQVSVRVGVSDTYTNQVSFHMHDGRSFTASPMFYGRPGRKTVVMASEGTLDREFVDDTNAFETMLRVGREEWLSTQDGRRRKADQIVTALERLGRDLEKARALYRDH